MKECCDQFLLNLVPFEQKEGLFVEIHTCPKCRKKIKVTFDGRFALGDEYAFGVIKAEYV